MRRRAAADADDPAHREELGWEFIQIYGLTETSPLVTFNRTRAECDDRTPGRARARRLGRAGAPALGVQVQISDVGEVLVRSNVVLDRYWNNPDATAEALATAGSTPAMAARSTTRAT